MHGTTVKKGTHLRLFSTEEKGKMGETAVYIRRIVATL
jgi:hypothetical protein